MSFECLAAFLAMSCRQGAEHILHVSYESMIKTTFSMLIINIWECFIKKYIFLFVVVVNFH